LTLYVLTEAALFACLFWPHKLCWRRVFLRDDFCVI